MKEIQHFSHKKHLLIFVEDLQDEVVCSGCDESVCGPSYQCSHCNFFLHKSCAELPHEIQHPLHPNHALFIRAPARNVCDACGKSCKRCFFYRCTSCDFNIDIECSGWLTNTEEIQHFSHKKHPLIFVKDLQNDGENEVVCSGCDKSVCGPAYKCSDCNFFLHNSCAELPLYIQKHPVHPNHALYIQAPARNVCDACGKSCKRCFFYRCTSCNFDIDIECSGWRTNTEEIQHFSHEKHPLIFVKDLQNDGENEVVCSGCDKSVCGPAYKCSRCNFFLHKSCAELSPEIQHPVHPNHTLFLQVPSKSRCCNACRMDCDRGFFYHCRSCDFDLDIECASGWRTKPDDCHQHEFVPILKQIQFACEVCGKDSTCEAQVCLICQLLAHTLCTRRLHSIRIRADCHHLLTFIYSLGKVIKEQDNYCSLCYKKINLKYAGYYCQQCNFVAHFDCAYRNRLK